jgi:hypothetical protein
MPADDISCFADHEEWHDGETIQGLVDGEQRLADLNSMRARYGLGSPRFDGLIEETWLGAAICVAAWERAELAAPANCYTAERLANETPGVLDWARTLEWCS